MAGAEGGGSSSLPISMVPALFLCIGCPSLSIGSRKYWYSFVEPALLGECDHGEGRLFSLSRMFFPPRFRRRRERRQSEAGDMAKRIIYPLYQLGNPQLRVFRTNYFLTLVRPGVPQSEDTVQFRIPMEMTRVELKDYLESIYNVPVAAIRTRIQHGSNKQRDHKNRHIKKPDYKVAYVQLAAGQTFQFPDLFPEREETIEPGSFDDIQKKFMEDERQRQKDDPRQAGVPRWFGL